MSYQTFSNWGPTATPSVVKRLILIIACVTLISAASQTIFEQFNLGAGPQDFLSLSLHGIRSGYIWQPLTYFFIQETLPYGLTLFYLLTLAFNLYLLWVLGSSLNELLERGSFLRFYLTCGIGAGLIALAFLALTGSPARLAGTAPVILSLLTAWSMAYAEAQVLLFFLIPFKAKYLVAAVLGVVLLMTFSHWDLPNLSLYISAILIGYFYAAMAWGWRSPFPITKNFDNWLITLGMRLRRRLPKSKGDGKVKTKSSEGKIIEIHTEKKPDSDDAFVDAMLAKISKHGESSLTWHERSRLQHISERKSRDKK